MHRLDIITARRLAVKAQMLGSQRPVDLLSTVERLTSWLDLELVGAWSCVHPVSGSTTCCYSNAVRCR